MADSVQIEILDGLYKALKKQIDYYSRDDLNLSNVAKDERIAILTELGTIHTRLTSFANSDMLLTLNDVEKIKSDYQNLIKNIPSGSTYDDTEIQEKIDNLYSFLDVVNVRVNNIDLFANVANPQLSNVHKLFRESANGINKNVKYCVVGDSTRHNTYNEMIDYYTSQLKKINVEVYNNASSGQSGYDWAYNIDQTTLNQLLTFIGANEDNCIIEFSHGINDFKNNATEAQVKAWLLYGLTQLITAKPKVKIILCTPINTVGTDRNSVLKTIYQELASELNLPLIDCTIPTKVGEIQGNSNYYFDSTHPNKFGSRRLVDYILDNILPLELFSIVTITPYFSSISSLPTILDSSVEFDKFWNVTTGADNASSGWRRLALISVQPNFQLKVTHKGNRVDSVFFDGSGVFVSRLNSQKVDGSLIYTIPPNCFAVGINLSSEGSVYDSLGDTPIVEYVSSSSSLYLSVSDMHLGLNIKNRIDKFYNGILIDDYGFVGSNGQSLKIDVNNKTKWL